MALVTAQWGSKVLEKATAMSVLLPDVGEPPFPTLYLLHGLGDDHSTWLRNTRLEQYARNWPMMIVMPDGYQGFYTKNEVGPDYATHLGEELVTFVERNFPAQRHRSGRAVGGLSMGGYGALRLGLGYAGKFCSIHSHSGALLRWTGDWEGYPDNWRLLFNRVFGEGGRGTSHDLLTLASAAADRSDRPQIRIDCGTEDYLIEDNRRFHQELEQLSYTHEYVEYPGEHNWDYWDLHIREALEFHARGFGISPIIP